MHRFRVDLLRDPPAVGRAHRVPRWTLASLRATLGHMHLGHHATAALLLTAGFAVACSELPTTGSASTVAVASPLIGTWSVAIPDLERPSTPPASSAKQDPDEVLRRALRGSSPKDDISIRITYRADRAGVIATKAPGVDRKQAFSWGLLSATPQQIRIDQEASDPPRLERITFRIVSPDTMTILDGAMQGSSLTRVK